MMTTKEFRDYVDEKICDYVIDYCHEKGVYLDALPDMDKNDLISIFTLLCIKEGLV